jgi:4-hydroxy-4-methyl-2-oxoglutarate aldolase
MWKASAFAGPAHTIECAPGDNLAIHAGLARARPGCVLAVSVLGRDARGYWGEVLTTAAEAAGVAALVIEGTVRDIEAIERHGFPVHARGCALAGASKTGPGRVAAPVAIGDVLVRQGDWLVGDADGVVLVPAARLQQCRDAAVARAAKESTMFESLRQGSTTVELLGLDVSAIEVRGVGGSRLDPTTQDI